MLRYFTIVTLFAFICGCSGKGSDSGGSSSGSSSSTATIEKYRLGGAAIGLKGNLVIANNNGETQTIAPLTDPTQAKPFVFNKQMNKGELYDVKIVALPKGQLCDLQNSKNYIYRDRNDVTIECADLTETKVKVTLPTNYALDNVRLLSNYQGLGGAGETPLTDTNATLTVFDNSVISLLNEKNEILSLSYINDASLPLEINSKTTAIALMLLEPTIATAMQNRNLTLKTEIIVDANGTKDTLWHWLTTRVNSDGSLDTLTKAIQTLVDKKNGNLNDASSLSAPLSKVLSHAATALAGFTFPTTGAVLQKFSSSEEEVSGVAFSFITASGDSGPGSTNLTTENKFNRYVSVESAKFTADTATKPLVAPLNSKTFTFPSLGSQQSIDISIIGPGMQGAISDTKKQSLLNATAASGVVQFFLPSINMLLGTTNPANIRSTDCLSNETIEDLQKNSSTLTEVFKDKLTNKKYFSLLSDIAINAREDFIKTTNTRPQSYLEELFSCNKFGAGVLIQSKKNIATENTKIMLALLNSIFSKDNLQNIDLFKNPQINLLARDIENSYAERVWTLSNALAVKISLNKNTVIAGTGVTFDASCNDPITKKEVTCTVTWDFGDATTGTGTSAPKTYSTAGKYTVTATAKNSDGAQATSKLDITVVAFAPNIKVSSALIDINNGSQGHNYGNVRAGSTNDTEFTIFNNGVTTLNISAITNTGSPFSLVGAQSSAIEPGKTAKFSVRFRPVSAGNYSNTVSIVSNDPLQNTFTFTLTGSAIGNVGSWITTQDGNAQSFTAKRITALNDTLGKTLQIRLFESETAEYPQIRILIKNYDVNTNDRGAGVYSLDDNEPDICLGFFGKNANEAGQYCTKTMGLTDSNKASGTMTILPTTDADIPTIKKAAFDFKVLQRFCTTGCTPIGISGELQYESNL